MSKANGDTTPRTVQGQRKVGRRCHICGAAVEDDAQFLVENGLNPLSALGGFFF